MQVRTYDIHIMYEHVIPWTAKRILVLTAAFSGRCSSKAIRLLFRWNASYANADQLLCPFKLPPCIRLGANSDLTIDWIHNTPQTDLMLTDVR